MKAFFRRRLDGRLAHVEQHLLQRAYLLGNDFSIAGVHLFVVSNWAHSMKIDLSPYPILALRKRVGIRPTFSTNAMSFARRETLRLWLPTDCIQVRYGHGRARRVRHPNVLRSDASLRRY